MQVRAVRIRMVDGRGPRKVRQPLTMCMSTVSGHAPHCHSHFIVTCTANDNSSNKHLVDIGIAGKIAFRLVCWISPSQDCPFLRAICLLNFRVIIWSCVVHLSTLFSEDEITCVCPHHAYCSMQHPLLFVSLFVDFRFPVLGLFALCSFGPPTRTKRHILVLLYAI
jgi:hypothetical protein